MKETDLLFGIMASLGREYYSFDELFSLVSPFSVSESSLRTVLSRMNKHGMIRTERLGKKARYSFDSKGGVIKKNVAYGFRSPDWSNWDGAWTGAAFTVPDPSARHSIRVKLTAYRFAPLYPGFWLRPYHHSEDVYQPFESYIITGNVTLFKCTDIRVLTGDKISQIWNLPHIDNVLSDALGHLRNIIETIHSLSPREAFIERIRTGQKTIQSLSKDPLLPPVLLPEDWKGFELRRMFTEWERKIRPGADIFVKEVLNQGGFYEKEG